MSLDGMDYSLMLRIKNSIDNLGQGGGNSVPLSVYNDLAQRYNQLRSSHEVIKQNRDELYDNREEWAAYAERQKARAEQAEAELARLRGQSGSRAA